MIRGMMQACKDKLTWEFEEIKDHQKKMLSILIEISLIRLAWLKKER